MKCKIRTVLLLTVSLALMMLIVGCAPGEEAYQDGNYKGVSEDETLEVTLTLENGEIVAAEIAEFDSEGSKKDIEAYLVCFEDDRVPLLAEAHPALAGQIINQNNWDVDVFTGATTTSDKVREAAEKALQTARI